MAADNYISPFTQPTEEDSDGGGYVSPFTVPELSSGRPQEELAGVLGDPDATREARTRAEQDILFSGGDPGASRPERERQERNEFLAGQLPAGAPPELGPPGLNSGFSDLALRFDMGLSNRTDEREAKWRDNYPDGDWIAALGPGINDEPLPGRPRHVEGRETILVRRHPDENYFELDARVADDFELMYDLADWSQVIPSVVVEVLAFKGLGAAFGATRTAVGTAVRGLLSGASGEAARESIEVVRGYNRDTAAEVATNIGTAGVGAALFSAPAGTAADTVLNFRRAGVLSNRPQAGAAIEAAERLGVPRPLPNQISSNPLMQRLARQSSALSDTLPEYVRRQEEAMARAVARLRDQDVDAFLADDFADLHDRASAEIIDGVINTRASSLTAGVSIREGIVEYDELATTIVNRAYARAREIETPQFDVTPLFGVARRTLQDVRAAVNPELVQEGAESTVRLTGPGNELADVSRRILMMDPDLPPVDGADAVEQLRALREELFHLREPGPNATTAQRRDAARARSLYGEISRTLEAPQNADEAFLSAWREANDQARTRFTTLERIIVADIGRNENAQELALRFARPYQAENLDMLAQTLPPSRWNDFRDFYTANLMRPPRGMSVTNHLASFDDETLRAVYSDNEMLTLRRVGERMDSLMAADVQGALIRHSRSSNQIRDILENPNATRAADDMIARLSLPENETLRRGVVSSVLDDLIFASVNRVDNEVVGLNPARLRSGIADLEQSRILTDLMTPEERQVLRDADTLVQFFDQVNDAGTSLMAGADVQGAIDGKTSAMFNIVRMVTIGRALTNPGVQRFLVGRGGERTNNQFIRLLGVVAGEEVAYQTSIEREQADIDNEGER